MKRFTTFLLAAEIGAAVTFQDQSIDSNAAPILSSVNSDVIPNSYIIKFKENVPHASCADHIDWVQSTHASSEDERVELRKRNQLPLVDTIFGGLKHKYKIGDIFSGYSGHFNDDVVDKIRRHPDVEYVERDAIVHTMPAVQSSDPKCDSELERDPPWGLARVSHRDKLSFSTFNKYLYTADAGEGVDVYVIDTGVNIEHVDFEGRAKWGKTIPSNDEDLDGNGHGTHCSGTIAGKRYGVAKKANVYGVKVLRSNGSGSMSDVISGVDWAAQRHLEQVKAAKDGKRKAFRGSVANMSLGGGKTRTLDDVVNAAVKAGIHFAVAGGNDNADACNYSPAAAQHAVTVGASGLTDSRAYFSNHGKCIDIFAPGLDIQSTWIGSKFATNIISGTSMASPHIAGLLAYYLSLQPSTDSEFATAAITPAKLKDNLLQIATSGALTNLPSGTPNLLAWNGGGCSNYSSIIESGSYHVKAPTFNGEFMTVFADAQKVVTEAQKAVTKEMQSLPIQLESNSAAVCHKVQGFFFTLGQRIHSKLRKVAVASTA